MKTEKGFKSPNRTCQGLGDPGRSVQAEGDPGTWGRLSPPIAVLSHTPPTSRYTRKPFAKW